MDAARTSLVRLSAAVASGDADARAAALHGARDTAPARAVEEALLQSYLFLGFPAALTALAEWRILAGRRPEADAEGADFDAWRARGERVCRTVYGRAYEKLRANVRRVHPVLDEWMVAEGYGKVLGREGLDLATRELCIVAVLAATRWEPQLHSHLRGALHAGCSADDVSAALEEGLTAAADASWDSDARALWNRVWDRFGDADERS